MIFDFKLNGVTVKKDIPTGWEQVKFRYFLQLDGNPTKALSIFTGIEEKTLKKANITGLDKLISTLSFLSSNVPVTKFPKTILGYKVAYDLGFESWGQYISLKEELDKGLSGIELVKQYPLFCAIYTMQGYNEEQLKERVEEFNNAPCTEVMAVGNFTLMKLIALKTGTQSSSLKEGTPMRKYRLALRAWWINTVFTVRFYILKRKLRLTEKN